MSKCKAVLDCERIKSLQIKSKNAQFKTENETEIKAETKATNKK